ncbi:MAG: hypothetical protein WDN29_08740 [Methylovirgula sp.]
MTVYALITVAAPVYLKKIGELKPIDIAGCVASLLLLAVPAVGSVYPVPSPPVNYFPYAFLAYLAVGAIWIAAFYRRTPTAPELIKGDSTRAMHVTARSPANNNPPSAETRSAPSWRAFQF